MCHEYCVLVALWKRWDITHPLPSPRPPSSPPNFHIIFAISLYGVAWHKQLEKILCNMPILAPSPPSSRMLQKSLICIVLVKLNNMFITLNILIFPHWGIITCLIQNSSIFKNSLDDQNPLKNTLHSLQEVLAIVERPFGTWWLVFTNGINRPVVTKTDEKLDKGLPKLYLT